MNKYVDKRKALQTDEFYEQNYINYLITKEKNKKTFKIKVLRRGLLM